MRGAVIRRRGISSKSAQLQKAEVGRSPVTDLVRAKRSRLPLTKVLRALRILGRRAAVPIQSAAQYYGARGKVFFRAMAEGRSRALPSSLIVRAKRSHLPLSRTLRALIILLQACLSRSIKTAFPGCGLTARERSFLHFYCQVPFRPKDSFRLPSRHLSALPPLSALSLFLMRGCGASFHAGA